MATALPFLLSLAILFGGSDEKAERLNSAATTLTEIMSTPEKSIPQDLLDKAYCVAVVPGLKKGAFIVGGQFGKGYISCRNTRGWSAPAAIRVEGGSVGFQIGGEETDVVMLVMNKSGADKLLSSKFTLGADGSVAAGPVGRTAKADTDVQMRAEILSYSRSRGAFAGVSLSGATLRPDEKANEDIYGKALSNREILEGNVQTPPAARDFVSTLNRLSPRKGGTTVSESHPGHQHR